MPDKSVKFTLESDGAAATKDMRELEQQVARLEAQVKRLEEASRRATGG